VLGNVENTLGYDKYLLKEDWLFRNNFDV